jgi:hypothetical protein
MSTINQLIAARKNIKKAQQKWQEMSHREHALAQPEGRKRAKPGTKGEGKYYRIIVRPKEEFTTFRYHDVGDPGRIQRLAGKRPSGSWDDHAWLIDKHMAYVTDGILLSHDSEAKKLLAMVGPVKQVKGDVFKGHIRPNIPEKEKPTVAQLQAQQLNIQKAQIARWAHQ